MSQDSNTDQHNAPQASSRDETSARSFSFLLDTGWGKAVFGVAFLLALVGIGWSVFPVFSGEEEGLSTNLPEAQRIAREELEERGVSTDALIQGTAYQAQPVFATGQQYIAQFGKRQDLADAYEKTGWSDTAWTVNYGKEADKRAVSTVISPQGELLRIDQTYPNAAEGADLSEDEARQKVISHLEERHDIQASEITQKNLKTTEHDNRTDYTFTYHFTEKEWSVKDARLVFDIEVEGNTVNGFAPSIKTPEGWQREEATPSGIEFLFIGLSFLLLLGALGVSVWFVLSSLRQGEFAGNLGKWAAGGYVVLAIVGALNSIPRFFLPYTTQGNDSLAVSNFIAIGVVGQLVVIGLLAFIIFVVVSFGVGVWRSRVSSDFGLQTVYHPETGWNAKRALEWYATPLIVGGLELLNVQGTRYLAEQWNILLPSEGSGTGTLVGTVDTFVPALASLLSVVLLAIFLIAVLGFGVYLRDLLRSEWLAALVVLVVFLLPAGTALSVGGTNEALLLTGGSVLVSIVVGFVWGVFVLQNQLAAYVIGLAELMLGAAALNLLSQSDLWVIGNGAAVLIVLVLICWFSGPWGNRISQMWNR